MPSPSALATRLPRMLPPCKATCAPLVAKTVPQYTSSTVHFSITPPFMVSEAAGPESFTAPDAVELTVPSKTVALSERASAPALLMMEPVL